MSPRKVHICAHNDSKTVFFDLAWFSRDKESWYEFPHWRFAYLATERKLCDRILRKHRFLICRINKKEDSLSKSKATQATENIPKQNLIFQDFPSFAIHYSNLSANRRPCWKLKASTDLQKVELTLWNILGGVFCTLRDVHLCIFFVLLISKNIKGDYTNWANDQIVPFLVALKWS